MIRIYRSDCQDFYNNGLGILKDFKTSPKIKENLNGSFELNFEYSKNGQNVDYIVVDNIIKAPYDGSEQLFRIKTIKPSFKKIIVYATHIFYDLEENFLTDVRPTNKSGVNAIKYLLDNAMFPTNFTVTGDSIPDNTAFYIRKNIVEAILGTDNCIVNRFGGEIERDNFNIILHKKRGKDRGVLIKEGKNIKEIELNIDFSTIVTRIIPQGSEELLLPELYVDSSLINTYRNPIVKKIEFSDIGIDDETTQEQACEKLREAANKQFANGIDKPSINVKIDWLELSKSIEYREKYSNLEHVRLGDTVTVQALGYEYKIRIISVEYDCLLERYTKFEMGQPKADFFSKQVELFTSEIKQNSMSMLQKAKETATALINNGFGGHVRVYPDRILIMDTDDETTAQNVWQWNLNGFGHSSTGINGEYGLAMTIDGQIVADRVTTGVMSVQRIDGLESTLNGINTYLELNNTNIQACVEKNTATDDKVSKLLIDLNEIKSEISASTNITTNVNGIGSINLEDVKASELITLRIHPTNTDLACLWFGDDTWFSDSAWFTSREIQFISEDETVKYEMPTDLYQLNGIYDELFFDYEERSTYVIHRIGFDENNNKYILENEEIEHFDFKSIVLSEGNYVIKFLSFDDAYIYARALVNNYNNSQFVTTIEMNSKIIQTENSINLNVNEKLKSFALVSEMNSAIEMSKNSITSQVNALLKNYSNTTQMTNIIDQKITASENSITQSVSNTLKNYSNTTQMQAAIKTSVDNKAAQINLEVSKKVNNSDYTSAQILLKINNDTSSTVIKSDKLDVNAIATFTNSKLKTAGSTTINGSNITTGTIDASKVTVKNLNASNITTGTLSANRINGGSITGSAINLGNGRFTVDTNGNMVSTSGKFTGTITSTAGTIGGWTITSDSIYNGSSGMSSNTSKYAFWAGETNGVHGTSSSNATFKIGHNGSLVSTSGSIAGWSISSNSLLKGDNNYEIGMVDGTNNTFLYVWNKSTNAHTFLVNKDGTMYSSNCNIRGVVNATSGSFLGSIHAGNGSTIGGLTMTNGILQSSRLSLNAVNGILSCFNNNGGSAIISNAVRLSMTAGVGIYSSSNGNISAPSHGGIDIIACNGHEAYMACARGTDASNKRSSVTCRDGILQFYSAGHYTYNGQTSWASSEKMKENIKLLTNDEKQEIYSIIKNIPLKKYDYKKEYGSKNHYGFIIEDIENTILNDLLHIKQSKIDKNVKTYDADDLDRIELVVIQELMKKIERIEEKICL